ncbi:MAG: hypothetical protein K6A78_09340 [Prevotella sp.]|nr:hypothetical protein [Prevotella sp.]
MKRKSKFIIFFIAVSAIISCTDMNSWGDNTRTPSLKANFIYFPKSQIELGGTANLSTSVQLQAVSTPWKISNPASEWLTVSPTEGDGDATITFTALENPTSDNIRTALLTLESGDANYSFSRSLTVNQSKANSVLTPSNENIDFTRESQTKTISVSANTDWTASCPASWVHLTKQSDKLLEIQVDENNEESKRTTTITLSGSKNSQITVTQTGNSISPSQTSIEFSRESQTKITDITANYNWTASCPASWVHLISSPETGKLTISVDENNETANRTATITLSGSRTTKIVVSQTGIYVNINQTDVEFSRESQSKDVNISSNINWEASCSSNWIHLTSSPTTGKLSIAVDANNGTTDRTGYISISKCSSSIKVVQHGYEFNDLVSELDFGAGASTQTLNIQTDGAWTALSNESWIHVSPSSGTGNSQISVTVDHNEGTSNRTGTIAVTVGDVTKYASIMQKGAYIDVSTNLISTIPSSGGTHTVTFSTSENWTVIRKSSWVTVDKASGSAGTNTITLSFQKNTQQTTRTDTTIIKTNNANLQDIRIITSQAGIYLYVISTSSSTISADGGTRTITFSSSEDWTVECEDSWVSIDRISGSAGTNTITFTFTNNKSFSNRTSTAYIKTNNSDLQNKTITTTTVQKGWEIRNNGHDYVDLGLPSGTLWATMNVGATSPEDYGDYFAWGETVGFKSGKKKFDWSTYKWCNGTSNTLTKYCTSSSYGIIDNKTELDLADDAARQNWGGEWRMPSSTQIDELINCCTSKIATQYGIIGRELKSKINGNSIFLPAAAYAGSSEKKSGYYRSRTLYSNIFSRTIFFYQTNEISNHISIFRDDGLSVRPVLCTE